MKFLGMLALTMVLLPLASFGSEDHNMKDVCKAECPKATNEEDAHKCMQDVVKKKKDDKKFRKSDCFEAFREHEKHEKSDGHKH